MNCGECSRAAKNHPKYAIKELRSEERDEGGWQGVEREEGERAESSRREGEAG